MSGIGWLSGLLRTSREGPAGVGGAKVIGVGVDSAGLLFSTEPPTSGGKDEGSDEPVVAGSMFLRGSGAGVDAGVGVAESFGTRLFSGSAGALGRLREGVGLGVAVGAGVGVGVGFFLKSRCKNPGDFSFSTGRARGMTGVGED